MNHWIPVYTLADLESLNTEEIMEGYRDGFANEPEPGNNRSRAYWHGWRNGMLDGHHREKDEAQAQLAHEFHEREKSNA